MSQVRSVWRASALALLVLVALLVAARTARAAPRLALVDGVDAAQLHQALEVSLQPWAFEVVDWPRPVAELEVDGEPPPLLDAATVAKNANARYVVWYDAGAQELVVHDAALQREERRPLEAIPADEVEASALALSIKTMLRLQPVPAGGAGRAAPSMWAPWVRLGPRFGLDGEGGTQLRAQLGIEVAPALLGGMRLGVLGEVGTATSVTGTAGTSGDWSEWSAMATLGRDLPLQAWTLSMQLAAGLSRGAIDGSAANEVEDKAHNQLAGQLTVGGLRAVGPFLLGGVAGLTARGAAGYALKRNERMEWEEPSLLLSVLAVARLSL